MNATPLDLTGRLRALGDFLRAHRSIWSGDGETTPARAAPQLRAFLAACGEGPREARAILAIPQERDPGLPADVQLWRLQADELTRLPELPGDHRAFDRSLWGEVPARKGAQVRAFVRALLPWLDSLGDGVDRLLEGCAGKGHLGRTLAAVARREVRLLERDPALCREADRLARARGAPARAAKVDVLGVELDAFLGPRAAAVALHACGDLHGRLLDELARGRLGAVAVAPCCYFRTKALPLRGRSRVGRASGLELDRRDLSFATCRAAIARGPRRERFVRREAWWLGFDAWCRHVSGRSPTTLRRRVEPSWLARGFGEFARRLASLEGIEPPSDLDLDEYETRGWRALHRSAAFERVRDPFRRALECWILLDRALSLQEAGLEVTLGTFCEPDVTPRNVTILARWP